MKCEHPFLLTKNVDRTVYPLGMKVPCGHCYQCKILYRKLWAFRLYAEIPYWKEAVFTTITYEDNPITLKKDHLQKFIKRLRKNLGERRIKHYSVGEYGDENHRPHYHQIILGLGMSDKDLINDSWGYGFTNIDVPNHKRIEYVVGYVDKKLHGNDLDIYKKAGLQPPFKLSSQGLGLQFFNDNKQQIIDNGYVLYRGRKFSIPRYYLTKMDEESQLLIRQKALESEIESNFNTFGFHHTNDEIYLGIDAHTQESTYLNEYVKQRQIISHSSNEKKAKAKLFQSRAL